MNKYVTNLTLPNGTNVLIKDSECRTNLSNEIKRATAKETELEEADTHLRNDLTTETNARKQSDTALQQNINAEVSAREQGDNKNNAEIAKINSNITGIENKNTEQDNELSTLRTMISSPYNFKGDVASISALPATGNVNDTYYVQDVKYKVTWTGSAWVQSSLSEADYQTELSELKYDFSEQLGEVKKKDFLMTNSYGVGSLDGNVGQKIIIGTENYWAYSVFDVLQNEKYKFITNTTSTNATAYVFFTTSDGTIVKRELGGDPTDDWIIVHSTIVPEGATKMYIQAFSNMNNIHKLKCWKCEYVDIQTQIDAMNAGNPIPSYYKEHIASKIEMINANSSIKNGMTFAFITDTHVPSNSMNSKYLLKEIFNKTKTPFVIFGGDVPRAFGTKDDLDEDIQAWSEYVAYLEDKIYQIRGNHDFTIKKSASENEGYTYSDDKVYSELYREQELSVHGLADSMCFYIDNPMQKIHIICMNEWEDVTSGEVPFGVAMSVSQNQLDWLIDILKIDGYTNIIVTHHTISPNLPDAGGMQHIQGICEALNNRSTFSFDNWGVTINVDFTNATSFVAFNLCGNSHRDASGTTNNVLSIETTCDAHYQDDGYGAVVGTVTEQAFDVFTINTENRTIKAVRVGRGNDREWNY